MYPAEAKAFQAAHRSRLVQFFQSESMQFALERLCSQQRPNLTLALKANALLRMLLQRTAILLRSADGSSVDLAALPEFLRAAATESATVAQKALEQAEESGPPRAWGAEPTTEAERTMHRLADQDVDTADWSTAVQAGLLLPLVREQSRADAPDSARVELGACLQTIAARMLRAATEQAELRLEGGMPPEQSGPDSEQGSRKRKSEEEAQAPEAESQAGCKKQRQLEDNSSGPAGPASSSAGSSSAASASAPAFQPGLREVTLLDLQVAVQRDEDLQQLAGLAELTAEFDPNASARFPLEKWKGGEVAHSEQQQKWDRLLQLYLDSDEVRQAMEKLRQEFAPSLSLSSSAHAFICRVLHRFCCTLRLHPSAKLGALFCRLRCLLVGELAQHGVMEVYRMTGYWARIMGPKTYYDDEGEDVWIQPNWESDPPDPTQYRALRLPILDFRFWPDETPEVAAASASSHPASPAAAPPALPSMRVRVGVTTACDYLCAELLQLAGNVAQDSAAAEPQQHEAEESGDLRACHVQQAVCRDDELSELARRIGLAEEFGAPPMQPLMPPEAAYPQTQAKVASVLQQHAWFHRADEMQSMLQRWRDSQFTLATNAPPFRLVSYYGQRLKARYMDTKERAQEGRTFQCLAFDVSDATGRQWPLLLEYRVKKSDPEDSGATLGTVRDRSSSLCMATLSRGESGQQPQGKLTWRADAAWVFRHFAARTTAEHAPAEDNDEDEEEEEENEDEDEDEREHRDRVRQWREARHMASTQTSTPGTEQADSGLWQQAAAAESELRAAVLQAVQMSQQLRNGDASLLWRCTQFHPAAVVRQFSVAPLRAAFDSPEVRPAASEPMPDDVLGLIAEFALGSLDLALLPGSLPTAAELADGAAAAACKELAEFMEPSPPEPSA